MTPSERIRRTRELLETMKTTETVERAVAPALFPRNTAGLAVLFMLLMPLVFKAIMAPTAGNILGYGLCTIGFGLSLFAVSQGQAYQAQYEARRVADPAKIPLKMIGAGLLGLTAAVLTLFQGGAVAQALAVAPVVAGLSMVSFGIDPMKPKGLDTQDEREAHTLEDYASQAAQQLDRIRQGAGGLAEPDINAAMLRFEDAVSMLLNAAADAPERARTLRKHFTVYLTAAADASDRFTALYAGTGDARAKVQYLGLMQKLIRAFEDKARAYAEAGRGDLEVEMDVLEQYIAGEARVMARSGLTPAGV